MGPCGLSVALVVENRPLFLLGKWIPPKKGEEGSCHMKIGEAPLMFRRYECRGKPLHVFKQHQRKMLLWVQSLNSPVSQRLHPGFLGASFEMVIYSRRDLFRLSACCP